MMDCFSKLLLLDASYLSLVTNWAAEDGWASLLLFWLETESSKFNDRLSLKLEDDIEELMLFPSKAEWSIARIIESYSVLDETHLGSSSSNRVGETINNDIKRALRKLISQKMPLSSALSLVSDIVADRILQKFSQLPSSVS
jgi:hypothetical protein